MNRQKLFLDLNNDMKKLFGNKLKEIILYGSFARNEQSTESDIDFMVLVEDTEKNLRNFKYKIAEIMSELSLNYDILVSITEETYDRFEDYSDIIPFYNNIKNEGIHIYGK
jgi:predicted nucleotidyltransferase